MVFSSILFDFIRCCCHSSMINWGWGRGVEVNSKKKIKWSKGCLLYVGLFHGIVQHTSVIIMVDMFLSNSCQKWSIGRFLYVRMGRDLVQHSSRIALDIFLSNFRQKWSNGCLLYVRMDRDFRQTTAKKLCISWWYFHQFYLILFAAVVIAVW